MHEGLADGEMAQKDLHRRRSRRAPPQGRDMQDRDPRAVLGLPLDATRTEAQQAFRALAKQTHPDAGGDPVAFRAVAAAWAELGAVLPDRRRPPARSPHVAAYRTPESRLVWAEERPAARPVRREFAVVLQAEMMRLAA
jgi:hypothetical protein